MDRVNRPKDKGASVFAEMVPPVSTHVTSATDGDIQFGKRLCGRLSGLSKTLKRYADYVLEAVMDFLSADGEPMNDRNPNAGTIGTRPSRRHPSGAADAENSCPLCASARTLDSVLDGPSAPASLYGDKESQALHSCYKTPLALVDSDSRESLPVLGRVLEFEPRRTAFPIPIPPRQNPDRRFPLNVSPMEDSPQDCEYCEPYMRGPLPSTPVWPDYYNFIDSYNLYTYMHE